MMQFLSSSLTILQWLTILSFMIKLILKDVVINYIQNKVVQLPNNVIVK
jgi:hypothetical protein